MTNAELLAKIKAEIERLENYYTSVEWYVEALLSFLSTLESEKPMNQDGLENEAVSYCFDNGLNISPRVAADFARHFYELGCTRTAEKYDEIEYNRQRAEESVPNELEEAAVDIADKLLTKPKDYALSAKADYWNGVHDGVIAGAKWQEEKDQETIKLAEDHAFLAGADWQKEQMMKEAVEERVQRTPLNGPLGISAYCCNFPSNHPFYHCKEGDKVRIIIVKEEN